MTPMESSRDDEEYFMHNSGGRGIAVFFGFSSFGNGLEGSRKRPGVEKEIKLMTKAYQALGFKEIILELNLTRAEINEKINDLQQRNYEHLDSLCITVSSHGSDGWFVVKDGYYKIEDLIRSFTSDKVPSLAGKPKIFILQCCRGTKSDQGSQLYMSRTDYCAQSGSSVVVDGDGVAYCLPTMADLLIAFATVKGYVAYHSDATPFFYYLSKTLVKADLRTEDFLGLVVTAFREMAENFESKCDEIGFYGKKQMPSLTTTLTRKIYFRSSR